MLLAVLALYALCANLGAYALFGIDKVRTEAGGRRIRESTLIGVALAGGWPGAKAAQRRFRHKTRKQPFGRRLNAAGLGALGLALVAAALAGADPADRARAVAAARSALGAWVAPPGEAAPARAMPRRFGPGSEGS